MDLHERFEQFNDDFLKFVAVTDKLHTRPDLCAFLLLDKLQPGHIDMVSGAEHDEIFLQINCEALEKVITDKQIHDLVRCGVRYSEEYMCLCMFA